MSALDWDKLRIFHEVARIRNFSKAAEVMGLSQSAISRQVRALEESLNAPLFHRHARGLILTEQGELLYQTTMKVAHELREAEGQSSSSKEKPIGSLRVTTTVGFGSHWLVPRLKEFTDLYPEIELQILLTDHELDLGMRDADVAVRFRAPHQVDLVRRSLFIVHYHIAASEGYLEKHGTPKRLEDLNDHDIVVYGENAPIGIRDVNWLLTAGSPSHSLRKPILRVDNLMGVLLALQAGMGIGMLPNYMVPAERGLVRILEDVEPPSFRSYLVYPEELRHSKRIRVFCDFLLEQMESWHY